MREYLVHHIHLMSHTAMATGVQHPPNMPMATLLSFRYSRMLNYCRSQFLRNVIPWLDATTLGPRIVNGAELLDDIRMLRCYIIGFRAIRHNVVEFPVAGIFAHQFPSSPTHRFVAFMFPDQCIFMVVLIVKNQRETRPLQGCYIVAV